MVVDVITQETVINYRKFLVILAIAVNFMSLDCEIHQQTVPSPLEGGTLHTLDLYPWTSLNPAYLVGKVYLASGLFYPGGKVIMWIHYLFAVFHPHWDSPSADFTMKYQCETSGICLKPRDAAHASLNTSQMCLGPLMHCQWYFIRDWRYNDQSVQRHAGELGGRDVSLMS